MEAAVRPLRLGGFDVLAFLRARPLTAAETVRVRAYLQALSDLDGYMDESDPAHDCWLDAERLASRRGLVSTGSEWSTGTSITRKGERFLAA